MRALSTCLIGLIAASTAVGSAHAAAAKHTVTLVGQPLVMRLNKDEFRIAFGVEGKQCTDGCSGSIRYRISWKAADGTARSEARWVSYSISPAASRTIAVDRQYLDTAEGANTTDVTAVSVDRITCQHRPATGGT